VQIRKAIATDAESIADLFYNTVTSVNTKDYNPEQIAAWANGRHPIEGWIKKIADQHFIVAQTGEELTGFASITQEGYIDFTFVHHEWQGQGIATKLLNGLLAYAAQHKLTRLTTHASITARPFFEKQGFSMVKQQTVNVRGVYLTNFVMETLPGSSKQQG